MVLQRALGKPGHRRHPRQRRLAVAPLEQAFDGGVTDCRAGAQALCLLFAWFFHCVHLSNDLGARGMPKYACDSIS